MSEEIQDPTTRQSTPQTVEPTSVDSERPGAFTGAGEGSKAPLVPKNVQKLATRTLILILGVGVIVFGIQKLMSYGGDLGAVVAASTKDDILALKLLDDGSQVVVIHPDGTVVASSDYRAGSTDRDAVWNPSGNRAFFVSDRKEGTTHIYRWNPEKNDSPEQRTVDQSSRSEIEFPVGETLKADESALIATRGNIEEFFTTGKALSQRVLPPTMKDIAQGTDGEGSQGAFQTLYSKFGTSFREGRWCRGKSMVAAVMRRESGGEILVLQSLTPTERGLPSPAAIFVGDHIEIDVNPVSGDLGFSVAGFDYPSEELIRQNTKNGVVQRRFRNALGIIDLQNPSEPKAMIVAESKTDAEAYGAPTFSPDGSKLLLAVGSWKEGALKPVGLALFPAREQGAAAATGLIQGEVYEPSWSPDGTKIVYVRRDGGQRTIFVAGADGSNPTALTAAKGDFAQPRFSPQK